MMISWIWKGKDMTTSKTKKITKKQENLIHKAFEHMMSVRDGYHGGNPYTELNAMRSDVETIKGNVNYLATGGDTSYVLSSCDDALALIDKISEQRELISGFTSVKFGDSPDSVMLHELLAGKFIEWVDSELVGGVDNILHNGVR